MQPLLYVRTFMAAVVEPRLKWLGGFVRGSAAARASLRRIPCTTVVDMACPLILGPVFPLRLLNLPTTVADLTLPRPPLRDPQLAPRDVVSRTILSEMRLQKAPHMYLDISHRPADWIRGRFPSIYEHCLRQGLDMTVQPLPVVPAAHYFCGGVATDLTGRTTVPGLFAAGESAAV